jgi:hypothetical protein
MKRKIKFLAMAAAALTFAACSEELVPTPEQARNEAPESNVISFSTYMGRTGMTRAGATGSIDTDKLKEADYGFGVFAYYTGTKTYGQYQAKTYSKETGKDGNKDKIANFMFNQKVEWNNGLPDSYVSKWTYTPLKYWPNEVSGDANHDTDDQNNNTSNDPALGSGANGGNVSFFAYAPYVEMQDNHALAGDGITRINGKGTLPGANAQTGDPIITYILPSDANTPAVDLLWGTAGTNGTGVTGAANLGVQGDGNANTDMGGTAEAKKYAESIIGSYRTNADLTKQTTVGTVNFAFKHALAKIGGSYTGTGVGDDEDGSTPTNGLLAILDLDDLEGGESGGSLEKYLGISSLEDGSKAEWNKYNTKVTINELVIEGGKQLTADGLTALQNNDLNFDYTSDTYVENLINSGDFNLATGQWSNFTNATATTYTQTILPTGAEFNSSTDDADKDGVISEELAEPTTDLTYDKAGFESLPIGVTTVAKNVYEKEANPLVFFPGSKPILTFTITYTVRTYDPQLKNSFTEVKQKIKKNLYITDPVELNKQYNILMHLGLTSVKFTATVSDWEVVDATGTTTAPTDGSSPVQIFDEDIEHVYLPINVGAPSSVSATITANANANLTGKAFTVGSATTAIGTVDAMNATFSGESEKSVEMSHVTMIPVDDEGNVVDWITYVYDNSTNKGTITVADNISPVERTAKIRVIYDGTADEYDITQYGVKVQNGFTVNVYTDAAKKTAATLTALPSASTKYYTTLTAQYLHSDKANNEVSGTAVSFPNNPITSGYTITAGDITTVDGTTFTTTQYVTEELTPAARTETTTKTKVTYGGVDVELVLTQNPPELNSIALTIGGATSQNVSATATNSGTIEVVAKFKDSANKDAGSVTVGNNTLVSTEETDAWVVNSSATFATYTDGENVIAIGANNTGNIRSTDITITYGTITSNKVTITQSK